MKGIITFKGTVEKFPSPSGWHYMEVPKKYTIDGNVLIKDTYKY